MNRSAVSALAACSSLLFVALFAACNGQEDIPIGSDTSAQKSQGAGGSAGSTGVGAGGGQAQGGSTSSGVGGNPAQGGSTSSGVGGNPAQGGSSTSSAGGNPAQGGSSSGSVGGNPAQGGTTGGGVGGNPAQGGTSSSGTGGNPAQGGTGGSGVGGGPAQGGSVGAGGSGCMPAPEVCDGQDNDCNGLVDDNALCPAGSSCQMGVCVAQPGTCQAGTADCDGNQANGCEVNVLADPSNCGACGSVCPSGSTCLMGVCSAPNPGCMPMVEVCDGIDNDCNGLVDDNAPCPAGSTCQQGMCVAPQPGMCAPGTGDCNLLAADGCETKLASDPMNCGACGAVCPSGASCAQGVCQ